MSLGEVSLTDRIPLVSFAGSHLEELRVTFDRESLMHCYFVELVANSNQRSHRYRFSGVRNLVVEEGFSGSLADVCVSDISSRNWDGVSVEVHKIGQDPGITFLASSMEPCS